MLLTQALGYCTIVLALLFRPRRLLTAPRQVLLDQTLQGSPSPPRAPPAIQELGCMPLAASLRAARCTRQWGYLTMQASWPPWQPRCVGQPA